LPLGQFRCISEPIPSLYHTPLYNVAAFRDRQEIINTNGKYNTYHVGAYLGDGLHEGAITSAMQVAESIAAIAEVKSERLSPELSIP
jgi:uncharacterized protein